MKNSGKHIAAPYDNRDDTGRITLFGLLIVLALLVGSVTLLAQDMPASSRGAVRPFVGAYIPTGEQRDLLKDAVIAGAQASFNATPNVALTGSFAWSPSKDRITTGDQTIDVYQYDVGAEARSAATNFGSVSPFIGAGVGGRSYSYRDLDIDAKHNFGGYAALGFDADAGAIGIRVEARDFVSGFKPLSGSGEAKTRNDIALFAALGVRF